MMIDAINLTGRLAALETGEVVAITNLFDAAGCEVDEPARAVSFVAGPDAKGSWFSDVVTSYGGARH